ncbi:MAG: hypothetical protein K0Q74_1421 [Gammaproteobacteria bacterium]|jgi:hypothetical protein|nr:hypothetical protein [Gammaproteobacteria bacterium]
MNTQSSPCQKQKSLQVLSAQAHKTAWFQRLVQAININRQMQSLFDSLMPKDLVGEYYVLEMQETKLCIGTGNAGHATRLRYAAPYLVESLQQYDLFSSLETISCIVMPPSTVYVPEKKQAKPISKSVGEFMEIVAATISDPDLKAAMLKLSGKNRSPPCRD